MSKTTIRKPPESGPLPELNIPATGNLSDEADLTRSLRRRVTDLQCLYEISRLKDDPELTVAAFLQRVANRIPPTLTHMDIAGATIRFRNGEFRSQKFIQTPFSHSAPIIVDGAEVGEIEICYINERPAEELAPDSNEQVLIETLGREVGKYIERRETEAALRHSERRFADMVDFLPDPTLAINNEGIVIAWNHSMEHLTDTPAADMVGKGDYEYSIPFYGKKRPMLIDYALTPDANLESLYPYIEQDGDTFTTDLFIPTAGPDGRHFWIKVARLFDSNGNIVGAIESTRDITNLKRIEADLKAAKHDLEIEREALKDKNTALREMLSQIDAERKRVIEQAQTNVDTIVMPLLTSLAGKAPEELQQHIELTRRTLEEVTAPFAKTLESRFSELSPRELQVCTMIRQGMSCKEIANTLNTSVYTVLNQRQRIRQKLGLTRQKANLATFLKKVAALSDD